jgi:hypothetical protein
MFVAGYLLLDPPEWLDLQLLSIGQSDSDVADVPAPEWTAPAAQDTTPQTDLLTPEATPPAIPAVPQATEEPIRSSLTVPRFGVGTDVVDHELVGGAERFVEGTRVWFWTHVQGGQQGQAIEHVWFHEGREVLRVPLRIGGKRWRTQSYKNLHIGSQGSWAVEAVDENGQVLARSVFDCIPGA